VFSIVWEYPIRSDFTIFEPQAFFFIAMRMVILRGLEVPREVDTDVVEDTTK